MIIAYGANDARSGTPADLFCSELKDIIRRVREQIQPLIVLLGSYHMKDFDLGGFLPPVTITETDHEGGGFVQVWQVKGGKWVKASEWFRGYRDVVLDFVSKAKPPKTN